MNDNALMGSGSGMWLMALIFLFLIFGSNGGLGGFGGNAAAALGYENLATSAEVQRGFDAQNSLANEREILSAVNAGTAQAVAATNQSFHDIVGALDNRYSELQRDVAGVAMLGQQAIANQNECCCATRMQISEQAAGINANIAQNRYEAAMNTAAINATTTAQTQKILDAMAQNKIEALQAQVNQLQLAQATAGMLKFPDSWTYGAGYFPPVFGGCCGNA